MRKIPKTFALILIAFLCNAQTAPTSNPALPRPARGSATFPVPRADANSKLAHQQLLTKSKQGTIDIYFEGDSITRRWGATDYPKYLANWKENFTGWNAADFGWGGDRIENILWRVGHDELDDVNPKIIVLLAGTNNIPAPFGIALNDPARVDDMTRGIKAVLDLCHQKAPSAVIILTAIFPRNDIANANAAIKKVNDSIARFADGKQIRFLNINNKLADDTGKFRDGMFNSDKLHPDLKAYQVWADALKPLFTEILGPPAKEDHAPPPTGDPSAVAVPAPPKTTQESPSDRRGSQSSR